MLRMNLDAEKRRIAQIAQRAGNDPNVVSVALVVVRRNGNQYENRFHISPSPDYESRVTLALGICGAAGTVAGARMDPPQPSPAGTA